MDFCYVCSECGRRFAIEPQFMVVPDLLPRLSGRINRCAAYWKWS